jgi:hypothetical protein
MKSELEIQEAHDFLHAVIEFDAASNEIPRDAKLAIQAAHDALCFVLEHPNTTFSDNLRKLRALAEKHGVRVIRFTSHTE